MKKTLLALALALPAMLATAPAQADLIINVNGGAAEATDPTNTFATYSANLGAFNINVISAVGTNAFASNITGTLLDVSALDVNSTGTGSLSIVVTETNLGILGPDSSAASFVGTFSGLLLNGITATRSFYLDKTNSGLQSILLGTTSAGGITTFTIPAGSTPNLFSLSEVITLTANGRGSTLSSDDTIGQIIPEPASLAVLGTMLLMGGPVARRRRQT